MKKKFLAFLLVTIMAFSLVACGSSQDSSTNEPTSDTATDGTTESDSFATQENPADATSSITIEGYAGTYTFYLQNAYVGDEAYNQLMDMGEDSSDYAGAEEGFQYVLLEYYVHADSGFEDINLEGGDVLGGDLWDAEYNSTYHYYVFDLYTNASVNYTNVSLEEGEESTVYILYELPTEVNYYVSCIEGMDREYWIAYDLSNSSIQSGTVDGTVEPETFYDNYGITMTPGLYHHDESQDYITVTIENNSDMDIEIQSFDFVVNGIEIDESYYSFFYQEVSSNTTSEESIYDGIYFESGTLPDGIESIETLSFVLQINDCSDYHTVDEVTIDLTINQ